MPSTSSKTRPNEREAVTNLQRYLRQISYSEPTVTSPPIDGVFSDATAKAVREYQKCRNIEPTGKADFDTWDLLYRDYLDSISLHSAPCSFDPFPRFPVTYTVDSGSRGFLVQLIQFILNELSAVYNEIPQNPQNGVWDEATEEGIRVFQKIHGLPVTGTVDRKTWNALTLAFNSWVAENQ